GTDAAQQGSGGPAALSWTEPLTTTTGRSEREHYMSSESANLSEREQHWQSVLVACAEALEKGEPIDREQLLAQHPEFAAELAEFFSNRDKLDQLAAPLREAAPALAAVVDALTVAPGTAAVKDAALGTARYFGDYELLEGIARGGMGVVYRARQVGLNRVVA